jgi:hypothetical protein
LVEIDQIEEAGPRIARHQLEHFYEEGGIGDGPKLDDLHDQAAIIIFFTKRESFADAKVIVFGVEYKLDNVAPDLPNLYVQWHPPFALFTAIGEQMFTSAAL